LTSDTPDFASWHHATLVLFATEAYIKMQDQRALIQQLRQLIAMVPEKNPHCLTKTQV